MTDSIGFNEVEIIQSKGRIKTRPSKSKTACTSNAFAGLRRRRDSRFR
jgi:hypothetical protein